MSIARASVAVWSTDGLAAQVRRAYPGPAWAQCVRGCVEHTVCQSPNYRLQRTVEPQRGRAASASFHYAFAARVIRYRVAAEPGR
jgi:hypothetical protein